MKTYIIGNWKMNFTVGEASLFLHKLLQKVHAYRDIEVVVAPSLVALQSLSLQVDRRKIKLACQNFCHHDFGAYTGEVSISQLRTLVDYAIVGHSERRYIFGETDKDIRAKVAAAIRGGLTPILCVGETESERTFGETADVIRDQVLGGLSEVSAEDLSKVIIAYEPVWAISGHGKPTRLASPLDVADVSLSFVAFSAKPTAKSSLQTSHSYLVVASSPPTPSPIFSSKIATAYSSVAPV